jgi:SAM-dependent methyltransferase
MSGVRRVRSWKSPLGPSTCPYENRLAPARWFHYFRFKKALELGSLPAGATVLEIGCWEGHFLPSLSSSCSRVIAVDDDSASLVERLPGRFTTLESARSLCASENTPLERLVLAKADAAHLPCPSRAFDAVFCLDTLPYVRPGANAAVLCEIARVLKPSGVAVFSLPVELGPAIALREALRFLSGAWLDGYTWRERWSALLCRPVPRDSSRGPQNLAGYDYRRDLQAIAARLRICTTLFLPANVLAFVSPTVMLLCRPNHA